jgi:hypothetical protein
VKLSRQTGALALMRVHRAPPPRGTADADRLVAPIQTDEMRSRLRRGWTARDTTGGRPGCSPEDVGAKPT